MGEENLSNFGFIYSLLNPAGFEACRAILSRSGQEIKLVFFSGQCTNHEITFQLSGVTHFRMAPIRRTVKTRTVAPDSCSTPECDRYRKQALAITIVQLVNHHMQWKVVIQS